jgi:hypothetical protein
MCSADRARADSSSDCWSGRYPGAPLRARRASSETESPPPDRAIGQGALGGPATSLLFRRTSVRQAGTEGELGAGGHNAAFSSSALEAHVAAQLAPVRGIERSQLRPDRHGYAASFVVQRSVAVRKDNALLSTVNRSLAKLRITKAPPTRRGGTPQHQGTASRADPQANSCVWALAAAHESPRTTKLYDRAGDEITLDEVERITI